MPEACAFEVAAVSDAGTTREANEDHCAFVELAPGSWLLAVADGVSGFGAGETASRMAVEGVLRAFREENERVAAGKRLYRAVQKANIDVHDLALVVPELRGMATTLTAALVDGGTLHAAHVGDSRLYRMRGGSLVQLTKDHTVVAERVRLGVLSRERARHHPDRSVLSRSLGRELIVSIDQLTTELADGDVILLCSDGLYNVLSDGEMEEIVGARDAGAACRALVDAANARGTQDNLTALVVRVVGPVPAPQKPPGLVDKLRRIFV